MSRIARLPSEAEMRNALLVALALLVFPMANAAAQSAVPVLHYTPPANAVRVGGGLPDDFSFRAERGDPRNSGRYMVDGGKLVILMPARQPIVTDARSNGFLTIYGREIQAPSGIWIMLECNSNLHDRKGRGDGRTRGFASAQ
jgi:hypothetical protein